MFRDILRLYCPTVADCPDSRMIRISHRLMLGSSATSTLLRSRSQSSDDRLALRLDEARLSGRWWLHVENGSVSREGGAESG